MSGRLRGHDRTAQRSADRLLCWHGLWNQEGGREKGKGALTEGEDVHEIRAGVGRLRDGFRSGLCGDEPMVVQRADVDVVPDREDRGSREAAPAGVS